MHTGFIRKIVYIINILAAICAVIFILFFTASIKSIYKNVTEKSHIIEKKHSEILDKYSEVISFVLKNKLPQNIGYLNLIGSIAYDLPPAKDLKINTIKDNITVGRIQINNDIINIIGCHNNSCLKAGIDKKSIWDKIFKSNLWGHAKITTVPVKKTTILAISISSFIEDHQKFLIIALLGLFILYSFQSLLLFLKNYKLTEANGVLLAVSNENE